MLTKIDWYGFSVLHTSNRFQSEETLREGIALSLRRFSSVAATNILENAEWKIGAGRAPYSYGWQRQGEGMFLFASTVVPHFLIELSGVGCDYSLSNGWLADLIAETHKRCTRLDLAVDILCDTDPREFAEKMTSKRFRSRSEFVSDSGTTVYRGSRKSDRYCRVYRYNPPHPRADFLRIEYAMRGSEAKTTCASVIDNGVESVCMALGEDFGWHHASYNPTADKAAEIEHYRPERREGSTVFWLANSVAPALVRLHQEGVIDVDKWLAEHVKSKL